MDMERPSPQLGTETETLVARILAWIVDALLVGIITGTIAGPLTAAGDVGAAIGGFIGLALTLAYFIYMEGTYGQTLGKKLLSIVVVKTDGGPCDMEASAIRNLLRLMDNIPVFYLVGLLVILVTDRDQRLGDLAADTIVTRVDKTA